MADEALNKVQQELLKSLGKKGVDLLVKISPLPDLAKEGYKLARELDKMATAVDNAAAGSLTSTDFSISKVAAISKFLAEQILSLARHDEAWWVENLKVNLLQPKDSTCALHKFAETRKFLLNLKETCDGIKDLARVAMVAAQANVKGMAKSYAPSLVVLDGLNTKESYEGMDNAMKAIDKIVDLIERLIRSTANMQKAVDRFLTLINNTNQENALKAIRGN